MTAADIPTATEVEARAYNTTLPKRNFSRELTYNRLAHYFVLRLATHPQKITGLAGYWLIAGEAHIITIAVHPYWQNLGLGQWLLLSIFEDALARGATVATLEVRPSNRAALALYHKFGFEQVGRRPRYYPDTGEDALILTTPSLTAPSVQERLRQYKVTLRLRLAQIKIDKFGELD